MLIYLSYSMPPSQLSTHSMEGYTEARILSCNLRLRDLMFDGKRYLQAPTVNDRFGSLVLTLLRVHK